MIQKEIKKLQKRLDKVFKELGHTLEDNEMDLVAELVDLELQLEAECGQ